jgi:TonB family protein
MARRIPRRLGGFPFWRLYLAMNDRARVFWQRHATVLMAVLLHIGLLWLALPWLINRTPPLPSDSLDVSIVPPVPTPKPIRKTPAVPPAKTNASASRPHLKPAPRAAHPSQPRMRLPLPAPIAPNPPMALPAASGPPATGAPADGSGGTGGGNGSGSGNGSQEGNDYLIRLKAYIDSHKGGARHREPHDAAVVLVLDPDGVLSDIHVVSSSGDPLVDDEIMAQLRQMSPFPKPPAVLFSPSKRLLPVVDEWIFPRP